MAQDKYGNIDDLLSNSPNESPRTATPSRRRSRPSPALGVMSGDRRPTSITDGLKAEKQAAEKALVDARKTFEFEKHTLLKELDEARSSTVGSAPIVLRMPVTKQEVTFELRRISPELIEVSPENERIQGFLDEISLKDILPSIRKHGQQKPGTVRPIGDGKYELIEGSRRLASVRLAEIDYLALVGDVPDADVRELGIIENRHQDVSPYEKAKAYQRQMERGEFENWTQLGAARGISSSHISRYRACAELDEIYVRILPSPSDMPLSYGETLGKLRRKDDDALRRKAEAVLNLRLSALANGAGEMMDVEEILKQLKSAVRNKLEKPTTRDPVVYQSENGKLQVKHSITNKGANKFEMSGLSSDQLETLIGFMKSNLKVDTTK
jgi:ParB family chromosome partitioning protein